MLRAALFVAITACAVQRPSGPAPDDNSATEPQEEVVTSSVDQRAAYAFRGTITELRQLEPAREGMPLVLEDVIVLSMSPRARRAYVADAMGGEYAGIEVSGCDECTMDGEPGTTVDVEGVLTVEADQRYLVTQARLVKEHTQMAEVPAVDLPTALATPDEAQSGRFVGGYVVLVDAETKTPSRFEIVDLTPPLAKAADTCANGPLYRYFAVEDVLTRARVHVSTAHWAEWSFRAWACDDADLDRLLRVGDRIDRLAGVLDVHDHSAMIMPLSDADCARQ